MDTYFVVAIHHADGYDGSKETPDMSKDIDDLNDEMVAAGVRVFVGGMLAAETAKSLRNQADGKILLTDGPYLDTKEHIGGFWVLDCSEEEALEWGRKAVAACRAPVEVRGIGCPSTRQV